MFIIYLFIFSKLCRFFLFIDFVLLKQLKETFKTIANKRKVFTLEDLEGKVDMICELEGRKEVIKVSTVDHAKANKGNI